MVRGGIITIKIIFQFWTPQSFFLSTKILTEYLYVIHVLTTDFFIVVVVSIHLHIKCSFFQVLLGYFLFFFFLWFRWFFFSFFFYFLFFCEKPEEAFSFQIIFFRDAATLPNNNSQSKSCKDKHTASERCGELYHHMAYELLTFPCAFLICLACFS